MMQLTVITVNFNNRQGLERTIKSVISQKYKDFEYIIVDGASTDGSVDIIRKYENFITKWISEPDTGIYNAMNKAVRMASGKYCLFMNSGDEIFSPDTLNDVFSNDFHEDYIQGVIFDCQTNRYVQPPKEIKASFYLFGNNNYHQASFIGRKLLLENNYDETLRIASDLKFNFQCLVMKNCSYRALDVIIAKYESDGRSVYINHDREKKYIYESFLPRKVLEDYADIEMMYTFPFKYITPVMKRLGTSRFVAKIKILLKRLLGRKSKEKTSFSALLNIR